MEQTEIVSQTPTGSEPVTATPAPAAAQAVMFQRLRWQLLRNSLRSVVFASSIRLGTILILSVVIWVFLFVIAYLGYKFLQIQDQKERMAIIDLMCGILFDLMFMVLAVMLFFSGGLILYSSLFNTQETSFLLCTPVRADQLFAYKFQGAMAFASWAFFLLGSPVLIAYGIFFRAPWYFYALLPLYAVGFVLLAGSCGAIACLLIVRFVPQRRKQVLIGAMLLLCAGIGAWGVHLLRTAQTIHWTHDAAKEVLSQFAFAQSILAPTHWVTQGLMAARKGDLPLASYRLALIMSNGLFFYVLAAWVSSRVYRPGFNRLATGGQMRKRYGGGRVDRFVGRALGFLDTQTRLLMIKDFRTFRRDPAQWAQVAIFLVPALLYFANIRRFHSDNLGADPLGRAYQNGVSMINLSATALLLCTYTGRFVYPMLSLEGRKFWILGLLPLQRDRLLWGKFAFSAIWSLLVSEALIFMSDMMLGVSLPILAVHMLAIFVIALGLSGISVGLGAKMANFRETDPSKIAVGMGGTVNLAAGLLFLILEVLLLAGPWHLKLAMENLGKSTTMDMWAALSTVTGLALGLLAVAIPMRIGAQALRQMEF